MRIADRSPARIFAGILLLCIAAGWLFYFFGLEAFLEAAYHGDSWAYFNEYAARWRGRHANPTYGKFLEKAQALLLRYAGLGTTLVVLVIGLYSCSPNAFTSFFSAETSPYNLALFRIAVFGTLLAKDLGSVHFFAQLPSSLQFPPPGLSSIAVVLPIDPTTASVVHVVFWGASICGLLGVYTRTAALVALGSGLYVMGVPQLYGKVNHYHHLLWFTALLVPSRCGDVLSVDAVWKNTGRTAPTPSQPDRSYALPIRYAWLLLGVIYFFPGFWKFVSEGVAWAFSENLMYQMRTHWFTKAHTPFFRIDRYPLLYQGGAAFTLLFEIGFLFTVPFRTLRPFGAGAAILFHESTRLLMSIYFWTVYPALVFLFDVRDLLVKATRPVFGAPLTLIHDDRVAWQRRVVGSLLRFDLLDQLQVRPEAADVTDSGTDAEEGRRRLFVSSDEKRALWQEGRFQWREGFRLIAQVPLAFVLLPLVPLARNSGGAGRRTAGNGWNGTLAIHLIGGGLLVANLFCGVAKINSFPVSVYPTFAVKGDSTVTTLRVEGIKDSGDSVLVLSGVQDHVLAGFAPGRLRGLFRSIFRMDNADERPRKLRALWSVLRRERDDLRAVTTVRFYEATYSNNPDRTSDPLLSKTLITTLDVSSEADRSSRTGD